MVETKKQSALDSSGNKLPIDKSDYEEEIFTIITDENYEEMVSDFCEAIFKNSVFEASNTSNDVIDTYLILYNSAGIFSIHPLA